MSQNWNSKLQFPPGSEYINRIVGTTFGPSKSSGSPMVTVSCEVAGPKEIEIDGEMYNIAGIKATNTDNHFVTKVFKEEKDEQGQKVVDEVKTAKCRERFEEFWTNVGLDKSTIDWDNIQHEQLRGKLVFTLMTPDEVPQRKNPTAAQIAAAKKAGKKPEGDIMKNPITGKPLVNWFPKIRTFFGLAPQQDGTQAPY